MSQLKKHLKMIKDILWCFHLQSIFIFKYFFNSVTGYLHLGHGLTSAIEDSLTRIHR